MEAGPSANLQVEVPNQYPTPVQDFVIPISHGAIYVHPPVSAGYIVWTFPNNPSPARSTAVFVSKLLCATKSSSLESYHQEQLFGPLAYAYQPAALVAAENSISTQGFIHENSTATGSDVNASVWSQFSFCNIENSVTHLHVLRGMKIEERCERAKVTATDSEEAENACTICLDDLCSGLESCYGDCTMLTSVKSETQPTSFVPVEPPVAMQQNADSGSMIDKAYNLEVPMQFQRVPLNQKIIAEGTAALEELGCNRDSSGDKDLTHIPIIVTSVSVSSAEIFPAFQAVNINEVVVRQDDSDTKAHSQQKLGGFAFN
eukprot:762618-Hanusia_phi.AAC.2